MTHTLDDIMFIYDKNFGRITSLIRLYSDLTSKHNDTTRPDLLRAAIIMLHSTLEDFLRNILKLRLPIFVNNKEKLNKIPLSSSIKNDIRKTKFELGELLAYDPDKTVQSIISESIEAYLDTVVSFNNKEDITTQLKNVEIIIGEDIKNKIFPILGEMIQRRHNIVHKADRDYEPSKKIGDIKSITLRTVNKYQKNLDKFVLEILNELKK